MSRLERIANFVSAPVGAMARVSHAVNNPGGFLKQFANRCHKSTLSKGDLIKRDIYWNSRQWQPNTIVFLIFSKMKPLRLKKNHLTGTTPIGRRDEELEVVGDRRTEALPDKLIPDTHSNIGRRKGLDLNFHFRKVLKMKLR